MGEATASDWNTGSHLGVPHRIDALRVEVVSLLEERARADAEAQRLRRFAERQELAAGEAMRKFGTR